MTYLPIAASLAHLLLDRAAHSPDQVALIDNAGEVRFADLAEHARALASAMAAEGVRPGDRVAIWLPKQPDMVIAFWAVSLCGAVVVPINPALKGRQADYILNHSGAKLLVTVAMRAGLLSAPPLTWRVDDAHWQDRIRTPANDMPMPRGEDLAALLYTSGSTGAPKGVMLSHANICTGAAAVSQYLHLSASDHILCVPPFSFDYGLNQLMSAAHVGATAILHDYLLPRDVLTSAAKYRATGLPGVPPLWVQLTDVPWPEGLAEHIRYITNTGGRLPQPIVQRLRALLPRTRIYLMYGLTEAFRSTYLAPDLVDVKPQSVGQAIPYAEIRVVRADGSETAVDEPGELVHMGPLVAQGYWQDPERSAERFKPAPPSATTVPGGQLAVWSGDTVLRDADGDIFFVGRFDELIKTSGYRVSPTEVEEVLYGSGQVAEAVVAGVDDDRLGQAIHAQITLRSGIAADLPALLAHCRAQLPVYMVPQHVEVVEIMPRNANGKLDRAAIIAQLRAEKGIGV